MALAGSKSTAQSCVSRRTSSTSSHQAPSLWQRYFRVVSAVSTIQAGVLASLQNACANETFTFFWCLFRPPLPARELEDTSVIELVVALDSCVHRPATPRLRKRLVLSGVLKGCYEIGIHNIATLFGWLGRCGIRIFTSPLGGILRQTTVLVLVDVSRR